MRELFGMRGAYYVAIVESRTRSLSVIGVFGAEFEAKNACEQDAARRHRRLLDWGKYRDPNGGLFARLEHESERYEVWPRYIGVPA
jgi:hypothetical protein